MDKPALNWRIILQISRCVWRSALFGSSFGSGIVSARCRLLVPLLIDFGLMLFVVWGLPIPSVRMLFPSRCCRCCCDCIAASNDVIAAAVAASDPTTWSNLGRLLVPTICAVVEENDDDNCCPVAVEIDGVLIIVGNSSMPPRFVDCFFAPIVDDEIDPFIKTLFTLIDAVVVGPFLIELGWKRQDDAGFNWVFATARTEISVLSSELSSTKVSNN